MSPEERGSEHAGFDPAPSADREASWTRVFESPPVAYGLLLAIGFLVFGQVTGFGLSNHDDTALITNNQPFLQNLSNFFGVFLVDPFDRMAFGAGGFYYRPVLFQSLIIDNALTHAIGSDSLVVFHTSNLLYHLITSCLVLALLVRLGSDRRVALFLAMVFLLHPTLVHATAWIPGRNDSLLGLFVVATVLALDRAFQNPRPLTFAATLLFWNLTLYTKEGGLFLSALVPLILFPHWRADRRLPKGTLALGALWIVSAVLWFILRRSSLGAFPLFFSQIPRNLEAFVIYLGKSLWPFDLSVVPSVADGSLVPGIAVLLLLAGLLANSRARNLERVLLGGLWLFAGLAPALLAPEITRGLEHRLYVPMIGLLIVLAAARWPSPPAFARPLLPYAALLLLAGLATLTLARLPDYENPRTYWESAARDSPSAKVAVAGLCRVEYVEKQWEAALPYCAQAASAAKRDPALHFLLGDVYASLERFPEAERAFHAALRFNPKDVNSLRALSELHRSQGHHQEARKYRERAQEARAGR